MTRLEPIQIPPVARQAPSDRMGFAFGLFNTIYGVAWFAGSAVMGVLYDISIPSLVVFSIGSQALCVAVLLVTSKRLRRKL